MELHSYRCSFGTPMQGHLGDKQFRHVLYVSLNFAHSLDHVANAF